MRITRFSDLCVRVLLYLTYQKRDCPVTINEISENFNAPRSQLVKVVHFMSRQGWISSQRGRAGGLTLANDPANYRMGDIMRSLEGKEELTQCEDPQCPLCTICRMRSAMCAAQSAFFDKLNEFTLADLCASPEMQAGIAELNQLPFRRPSSSKLISPRKQK